MERSLVSLVMHMSRVWGVAPFKSETYEISKPLVIYGFIIIFILSLHEIWHWFFTFAIVEKEKIVELDYIRLTSYVSMLLYLTVGGFSAAGRTSRLTRFLKKLEQIDKKITPSNKRYRDRYTMFVLAFYTAIRLMELIHVVYFWILFDDWTTSLMSNIKGIVLSLIKLQLVAFVARILVTLKSINKHLHHIKNNLSMETKDSIMVYPKKPRAVWTTSKCIDYIKANEDNFNKIDFKKKLVKDISSNKREAIESKVRRLSTYYADICRIVSSTTNTEGFVIILIMCFQMMYLQLQFFKFIVSMTLGEDDNWNYILMRSVVLSFVHISSLILFIEPFHCIHVQMENTSLLVQELKCICGERQALSNELDLFLRQLVLLKTTFSPLDICTMNRDLTFKILGALISYLVIMVTYGSKLQLSSLVQKKSKWVFV